MNLKDSVLKIAMLYSRFYCIDIFDGGFGTGAVGGGGGGDGGGGDVGPVAKNELLYSSMFVYPSESISPL